MVPSSCGLIANMKLNSPESIRTAVGLIKEHGSWSGVKANSRQTRTGVFVVKGSDKAKLRVLEDRLEKLAG